MALFKLADITTPPPLPEDADHYAVPALAAEGENTFIIGRHGVDLAALMPDIRPQRNYYIPSRGDWSLHNMLDFLLQRTGPADVWVCSWGITENPLRQVLNLLEEGRIRSLSCLFDPRVKTQCPNAYQLAMNKKVKLRLKKNHSKLLVIMNETWGVFVHSSANLTLNERLEFYFVSTCTEVAQWNRDWIALEMDDAQPFAEE